MYFYGYQIFIPIKYNPMLKKTFIFSLFLLCGQAVNLVAQNNDDDDKDQATLNMESFAEYQKLDKELKLIYNKVSSQLDENKKKNLESEQNKWKASRKSDCDKEGSEYEGGSMQPLIINECLIERTKARIAELNKMIK